MPLDGSISRSSHYINIHRCLPFHLSDSLTNGVGVNPFIRQPRMSTLPQAFQYRRDISDIFLIERKVAAAIVRVSVLDRIIQVSRDQSDASPIGRDCQNLYIENRLSSECMSSHSDSLH